MTACAVYGTIGYVHKSVYLDKRAKKELESLSRPLQIKFQALFEILQQNGKLEEPFGKKLLGKNNLFEIRIRYQGQWRAIFAYMQKEVVIVLTVFQKKTQKTPKKQLDTAIQRLGKYMEEI